MEPVGAERSSNVRDVAAGTAVGLGTPGLAVFVPNFGLLALPVWLICLVVGMYLMERSVSRRWIGKGLVSGAIVFLLLGCLWMFAVAMMSA